MSDFQRGDRVRLSPFGLETFPKRRVLTGTVVRLTRRHIKSMGRPPTMWVLSDGSKKPQQWAIAHWEPLPPEDDPLTLDKPGDTHHE